MTLYKLTMLTQQATDRTDRCWRPPRTLKSMPPVFPNGWIPVLESHQLCTGQVKSLDVLGLHLVAFRSEDGEAHVMDAHCPHLGAHMGHMGRVVGDCIECPFHGWRFRGKDGACTHVPYSAKVPEFIRAKTWLSCELLGLLFIWYHAEDEPPSWHLVDCPEISSGQWKVERRFEHTVHCHIQDIAENGADVGHFNKLHKASCLMTSDQFAKTGGLCWWGQLATHSWDAKWTSNGHAASVKVDTSVSLLGFSPDFLKQHVDVRQVGPALVILHMKGRHGDTLIVQALIPEGPLRIRVLHSFFPEPGQPWLMRWIYVAGFRSMVERDIAIWNQKTYLKQPCLVKEERSIAAFRKWYSQFYSTNSPTWQDVRDQSLEW
ncbi:cholesterol 7-desaturase nvd-like [Ixodes scapularis]|uniref:cholesterol 7-desaturase nvd-like n=1 Tax=Ixodes scapularis TaxID=6945 RepID=UPI001AD67846|nr:cholesterol 7-desaturase nvd-like [Ixodes scapularis]